MALSLAQLFLFSCLLYALVYERGYHYHSPGWKKSYPRIQIITAG